MRHAIVGLGLGLLAWGCRPSEAVRHASVPDGLPTAEDGLVLRGQGVRLVDRTLGGELDSAPHAELALERAYRTDPNDRTTARLLGRFLNLRLTEGDFSKAHVQAEIYEGLAAGEDSEDEAFVFSCFQRASRSAELYGDGAFLRAFQSIRTLEAELRRRVQAHPDDAELAAMAGNYALELAARVPVGRARRLRRAAVLLERQQARWSEQSVLAQGIGTAPGTRSVFAFWLGEVQLALGRRDRAAQAYATVVGACHTEGSTVAACELAELARHRMDAVDLYVGRSDLVPVWPRGAAACVACHAEDASIGDLGAHVARVPSRGHADALARWRE